MNILETTNQDLYNKFSMHVYNNINHALYTRIKSIYISDKLSYILFKYKLRI